MPTTSKKTFIVLSGQLTHQNIPHLKEIKDILDPFKENTVLVLQTTALENAAIEEQAILAEKDLITEHVVCYDNMYAEPSSIGYWDKFSRIIHVNKEDLLYIAADIVEFKQAINAGVATIDYGYINKYNAENELKKALKTKIPQNKEQVVPA